MRMGMGADQARNQHAVRGRQYLCVVRHFETGVADREDATVFDQHILQRGATLGIKHHAAANNGAAAGHDPSLRVRGFDPSAVWLASNSASVGVGISKRSRIVEQVLPPSRAMASSLAGSIRIRSTSMTSGW
jgi:hypothetical protein